MIYRNRMFTVFKYIQQYVYIPPVRHYVLTTEWFHMFTLIRSEMARNTTNGATTNESI